MNICFAYDVIYPSYGGCGVTTERFIEKLKERGHKLIAITSRSGDQKDKEDYKGIIVYRLPSIYLPKTQKRAKVVCPNKKKIASILKKEDVELVQIQNPISFLSRAVVKVSKRMGIAVVMGLHVQAECITAHVPILDKKMVNDKVFKLLFNYYSKSDLVVAPSGFAANLLKRYRPDVDVMVVSNGIDLKKYAKKRSLSKNMKGDKEKILFIGRLSPEKNLKVLIGCMPLVLRKIDNAKLLIAGDGPEKKALKKQADRSGLGKHVVFTGHLDEKELIKMYSSCSVFVLPSKVELQGMVVLEAMASGKPVIAARSEASGATELVKEGVNGFTFNADSEEELANSIIKILADKKLKESMGRMSRKMVKDHDIEKSIDKIEKAYSKVTKIKRAK